MATNEITPPTNQRPNYFAGQYLLEDDFQLQQQYHSDRQRWHHHLLHVSGIAEGLKVTKGEGDLAVNVSEGSAIDSQGQQITLLSPQKVDLTQALDSSNSATPNGSYTLYIGYSEQKTDQQTAGNEITSRRWQEEPKFQLSSAKLTDFIPLAKLTINSNVVSDNIDNSIRVYSGLRLPTLDGGIVLCSKNDGTTSLAELKGSLSIAGTLSVTDNVGIGMPANSVAKLQVQIDGKTTATSLKLEHNGSNFIVRPVSAGGNSSIIENTGGGSLIINPAGGNVGIGTSSPTEKLTVSGNLSVTGSITAGSLSVGNGTLNFGQTTRQMLNLWNQNFGVGVQSGTTYFRTDKNFAWYKWGSHNEAELNAGSDGIVQMVIKDGNVGIGTSLPTEKLTVSGNLSVTGSITAGSLSVGNGTLNFGQTTRQMLNLWNQSYGIGVQSGTTYFRTDKNFAWYKGGSHNEAELNAGSGGTVQMVIKDGNVGIGTSLPTEKLTVSGTLKTQKLQLGDKFLLSGDGDGEANDDWLRLKNPARPADYYGGLAAEKLWTRGGTLTSSDIRMKKDISPLSRVLDKLILLQGVNFRWKDSEKVTLPHLGLIAQEVETLFPELVEVGPNNMKAIDYTGLIALLIESIKEQQDQIFKLIAQSQQQ
jgi:hypothetical protein